METNETAEQTTAAATQPGARISRVTVGRVHNLGNYENVRYEISVDLRANADAGKIIGEVESALEDLQAKSPHSRYEIERARRALAKPASELDESDMRALESWKSIVADADEAEQKRRKARIFLSEFGNNQTHTDHKQNWDDDDNDPAW